MCLRLLSLTELLDGEERHAVQGELVAAATILARAAPMPGPLTDLRLPSGHTDALRALWVQVCDTSPGVVSEMTRVMCI